MVNQSVTDIVHKLREVDFKYHNGNNNVNASEGYNILGLINRILNYSDENGGITRQGLSIVCYLRDMIMKCPYDDLRRVLELSVRIWPCFTLFKDGKHYCNGQGVEDLILARMDACLAGR